MNGEKNPVQELESEVAEFYKLSDMVEVITEAVFNGDGITLQAVGNSLDIFLTQMNDHNSRMNMLCQRVADCYGWIYSFSASDADDYCRKEFEHYLAGRKQQGQEPERENNGKKIAVIAGAAALAFMKLLPSDQKRQIDELLQKECMLAHRSGFIEGYKAAVGRCAGDRERSK